MAKNNPFDRRLTHIPSEVLSKIARIDENQRAWIGGLHVNHQALGRLKRSVLVTSTGASTRIEGAKLTDKEIGKVNAGRDHKEVC